jgi:hypothetical protein
MPLDLKRVEYYNVAVSDNIAAGSMMLARVAGAGVDLLAFKAIRRGPGRTRFTLFPENGSLLRDGAAKAGLELDGPHSALLIRGAEEPGALSRIYERLAAASIRVEESCGIAHVNGGYGVVLYLTREDCDRAVAALEA